jgi:hypothetical protein
LKLVRGGLEMVEAKKSYTICSFIDNENFIGKYVDIIQKNSKEVVRGILDAIEGKFIVLNDGNETKTYICCSNVCAIVKLN